MFNSTNIGQTLHAPKPWVENSALQSSF